VKKNAREEREMIQVTETATEKLREALKEHGQNPAVRVYVAGSG
jgi:Fe-S cluster assembly iron-binding protein IscA